MKPNLLLVLACCVATSPLFAEEPKTKRMLEKEIVLPAARAEVWHLWTTNEGFQKSVGVKGSSIELKLGGKFEIYFGMDLPAGKRGSEGCTILAYHPLEMLAFTWNAPPSIAGITRHGSQNASCDSLL